MAVLVAPDTLTVDRHVYCDGVFNLRDLGGYGTADGRQVRWRTVFRADGLHRATGPGKATLGGLGWRTVIDLRTIAERDAGRYIGERVESVHLPLLRDTWDVLGLRQGTGSAAGFLIDRYLDMADTGAPAIAAAFELLASPSRLPAVFHCSAGKDRTGVLAALLLASLGVDDDTIAADYHLSGLAMDELDAWFTSCPPETAEPMTPQPAAFLACPPEAILGFLHVIRERHRSIDGYLHAIGIPVETLWRLRVSLLQTV